MAKRFTDTNKYKKSFMRAMPGAYKLLWDFLLHDCDHAGIWTVDFEAAQLYIGKDMEINPDLALKYFNSDKQRVIVLENGNKWFLTGFVEFQYIKLSETNRAHASAISTLKKLGLLAPDLSVIVNTDTNTKEVNKPLASPLEGAKEKEKEMVQVQGKVKEGVQGDLADWEDWGSQIVSGQDMYWEQMRGRKVDKPEMDEFISVAIRNKWGMKSAHEFRRTLNGWKSFGQKPEKQKAVLNL